MIKELFSLIGRISLFIFDPFSFYSFLIIFPFKTDAFVLTSIK